MALVARSTGGVALGQPQTVALLLGPTCMKMSTRIRVFIEPPRRQVAGLESWPPDDAY
jgi:hypothetical protein